MNNTETYFQAFNIRTLVLLTCPRSSLWRALWVFFMKLEKSALHKNLHATWLNSQLSCMQQGEWCLRGYYMKKKRRTLLKLDVL